MIILQLFSRRFVLRPLRLKCQAKHEYFQLVCETRITRLGGLKNTKDSVLYYHPSRSAKRALGAEGRRSPKASMPASTPVKIDATAAQVEIIIALPCFRPRVCIMGTINIIS